MSITMKAMPFDSEVTINPETGQEEYDRVAHAKDLADLLAAYFSNGILVRGSDLLTNELQVLHLSAMTCVVKPGIIVINGRTAFLEMQETVELAVGESNPRIDRVVAELSIAERNVYIKILKGAAAAAPSAPDIIQTEDIYQIPLAQVRINANQSVIASVTDERAGYISNVLLNQAPSEEITASTVGISEAVRTLYGLSVDNANVDKTLQKTLQGGLLNAVLTGFSNTGDTGNVLATDTLTKALSRLNNGINNLKFIQGSYTGDGQYVSGGRIINIGFTPTMVFIMGQNFTASAIKTSYSGVTFVHSGYCFVNDYTVVTNGFEVGTNDGAGGEKNSTNETDKIYKYYAIR